MFFFFSKILEFFIYPLTWVLALSIAALLIKKTVIKRRLLLAAIVVLILFSDTFLLNQFVKRWDIQPAKLKNTDTYSCAIVLGGFSSEGINGGGFFNGSADRFIQALKLYSNGKVSHILISSGNGALIHDNFEEADWVKTQLKEFKIPDSCVLIEDRSRNTIENAAFSKPILIKAGLRPPYLLITSAFHMRRSLGIFKKENLKVVPFPCNYLTGTHDTDISEFVPDAAAFATWDIYIKEVIGTVVNDFR